MGRTVQLDLIVTPANPLLLEGPVATLPLTVFAVFTNGAPGRTRTCNLLIRSHVTR